MTTEQTPVNTGSSGRVWWPRRYASDLAQAAANLLAQKIRTLLTALGIIFGVGAVIGMLAIGAGARDESLRFIEQLGVRNLLIESIPSASDAELQQRRRSSQGLNERDVRILEANLDGANQTSPQKTLRPSRSLPKPFKNMPVLYGVRPAYASIHNWNVAEGAAFSDADNASSAAVCVLGAAAKTGLLGFEPAVGKYIKLEDTWLKVMGVLREQVASGAQNLASAGADVNNRIYIPLSTFQYRFWDMTGYLRDPLDGVDIQLKDGVDSVQAAKIAVDILNSTHHCRISKSPFRPSCWLNNSGRK
jgi:putative ABC transport system permease protein